MKHSPEEKIVKQFDTYSLIIDLKFNLFKSQNIKSKFPNKWKQMSVEKCFREPFLLFVNERLVGECTEGAWEQSAEENSLT